MSNKVITSNNQILVQALYKAYSSTHLKLHKIYNPTPTHPNWEIEKHRVNADNHFLYVIEGSCLYTINRNETITLRKGQMILVSNSCPHAVHNHTSKPLHMFSMRFGFYKSSGRGGFINNFFKTPFALIVTADNPNKYIGLLQNLYQHFIDQKQGSAYAIDALLRQLLLYICEESVQSTTRNQIENLTKDILDTHGKNASVGKLASSIGLSDKQFTRLFRDYNDSTPPHQFIIKARINHAKYLLEDTELSIKSIAIELGYTDAFCFSKQFKKSSRCITHYL